MEPVVLAGEITDVIEACGDRPGLACRWVFETTDNATLARLADWFVARPLAILITVLVAITVNRLLHRWIQRTVDKMIDDKIALSQAKGKSELLKQRGIQRIEALGGVMGGIASLVVITIAGMVILSQIGVALGPFIAGAGVIGIALGFGTQSLVRDFISGIFMLAEDQYGIGDNVDLGDAVGIVEEVSLRTTRVRGVDGTVWFVPNGEIRRVGNRSQLWMRTILDIEVALDTDLDRAMAVLREVIDDVWQNPPPGVGVLEEPQLAGIEAFRESAIVIRVVFKVEAGHQAVVAREARGRIRRAFTREGIYKPIRQLNIRMDADE